MCIRLAIFLLAGGLHTSALAADDTLRVMTYNIHHGRGMDGALDVSRIADVITDHQADIVALQEVDIGVARSEQRDLLEELRALTGLQHAAFGKNLDFQGGDYGNAILSRFPIVSAENVPLRQIRDGEPRGVQIVTLDREGTHVFLLNTHLDHTSDDAERLHALQQILGEIVPPNEPSCIIFAGDLNDVPSSRTYRKATRVFRDAWQAAGRGSEYTFPADAPDRRIDYVLHGVGFDAVDAYVPHSEASDHRPVVATLLGCGRAAD